MGLHNESQQHIGAMTHTLYTIGHSNHDIDTFIALLKQHGVTALADVRSAPYSRYLPHFCQKPLKACLEKAGIQYVFLGKKLGARPDDETCYVEGKALYEKIAATEAAMRNPFCWMFWTYRLRGPAQILGLNARIGRSPLARGRSFTGHQFKTSFPTSSFTPPSCTPRADTSPQTIFRHFPLKTGEPCNSSTQTASGCPARNEKAAAINGKPTLQPLQAKHFAI